jgi:hypothetical protein
MNLPDVFLWTALEGAIGAEKVAFLRDAPLHAVIGHYDRNEEFTLAHAVGHVAKHAAYNRMENVAIRDGLQALRAVLSTEKTAAVGDILGTITKNKTLREAGKKMLGAGAIGTGAAVPMYAAGSMLSDKVTSDSRDKALQTAAGVGGMALLGYGGKKVIDSMGNGPAPAQ